MHIYAKDEVCMTIYSGMSIDSKPKNKKSTKMSVIYKRHNVNIHTKYKVSAAIYVDSRANQRQVPKLLPFENYKSESLNI